MHQRSRGEQDIGRQDLENGDSGKERNMGCRLMCQCEWPAGEISSHSAWLGEESRQKVGWGKGRGVKQVGGIERVRVEP